MNNLENPEEIWKDIPGYEGLYQVSNLGNVKSLERKVINNLGFRIVRERILKQNKDNLGYICVGLSNKGKINIIRIHRLVGLCFLSKLDNKLYINHKDGIKNNNRVENLEWCNQSENIKHSFEILGRIISQDTRNKMSLCKSKTVLQYSIDDKFIREWKSGTEIYNTLNINYRNISHCCLGRRKTAGGYKWKFKENI